MEIALVVTSKCTAACTHCSSNCGPRRADTLSQADIFRVMSEAAVLADSDALCFHITGGEPFLNFDRLLEMVAHGASLGADVTCVTNAYWARSVELAHDKLKALRAAGLTWLAVSVSRYHEEYVPLQNVRIALDVARSVGLGTELKGAITVSDLDHGGLRDKWQRELAADEINIFPVLPYLRDGAVPLPDSEYYREGGLPQQTCPDELISIETDGAARSCCGQGPRTSFLQIGNIHQDSLASIQRRFEHGGRQRILRDHGPVAFARAAIDAGLGHLLRDAYAGPCDLCLHVASDPQLRDIADRMSIAADQTEFPDDHTRKMTMSAKNSIEKLQVLIATAARDVALRDALIAAPEEAITKSVPGLTPSAANVEILKSIKDDLRRFGGNPDLAPEDASTWALGVMVSAIARARNATWTVQLTSIVQNKVIRKKPKPKAEGEGEAIASTQHEFAVTLKSIVQNAKPKRPKRAKTTTRRGRGS